jgi:FtsZ-interacting cell division protein YlmF
MELQQQLEKTKRALKDNTDQLAHWHSKLEALKLNDIDEEDESDDEAEEKKPEENAQADQAEEKKPEENAEADGETHKAPERRRQPAELKSLSDEELEEYSPDELKGDIAILEGQSSAFLGLP